MLDFLKSRILKKGSRGPKRTLTAEQKAERKDRALNTCYVTGDKKSPTVVHHIKSREDYSETVDPKYYDGKYNTRVVSKKVHDEYHSWKKRHSPASNRQRDHKKNFDVFTRIFRKRKKIPKSKLIRAAKAIKNKGRTSRFRKRFLKFRKKTTTGWKYKSGRTRGYRLYRRKRYRSRSRRSNSIFVI